jgi:hypothetical protein
VHTDNFWGSQGKERVTCVYCAHASTGKQVLCFLGSRTPIVAVGVSVGVICRCSRPGPQVWAEHTLACLGCSGRSRSQKQLSRAPCICGLSL